MINGSRFRAFAKPFSRSGRESHVRQERKTIAAALKTVYQAQNVQAATKLIWLGLRQEAQKWKSPPISWHAAKAQLAIQFEERFVPSE